MLLLALLSICCISHYCVWRLHNTHHSHTQTHTQMKLRLNAMAKCAAGKACEWRALFSLFFSLSPPVLAPMMQNKLRPSEVERKKCATSVDIISYKAHPITWSMVLRASKRAMCCLKRTLRALILLYLDYFFAQLTLPGCALTCDRCICKRAPIVDPIRSRNPIVGQREQMFAEPAARLIGRMQSQAFLVVVVVEWVFARLWEEKKNIWKKLIIIDCKHKKTYDQSIACLLSRSLARLLSAPLIGH